MLTRIDADAILELRQGAFISITGVQPASYIDAWGWALRVLGESPASLTDIIDADFANLSGIEIDACLDLGELRLLETIWQNFKLVSKSRQSVDESFGELNKQLEEMLKEKRKNISVQYGSLLVIPLTGDEANKFFGDLEREKNPARRFRSINAMG